jgi:hypothetical protein
VSGGKRDAGATRGRFILTKREKLWERGWARFTLCTWDQWGKFNVEHSTQHWRHLTG